MRSMHTVQNSLLKIIACISTDTNSPIRRGYANIYFAFSRPDSRGGFMRVDMRVRRPFCGYIVVPFDFRHKWIPGISSNDFNEAHDRWPEVWKFDILERARRVCFKPLLLFARCGASTFVCAKSGTPFDSTQRKGRSV